MHACALARGHRNNATGARGYEAQLLSWRQGETFELYLYIREI
jgi:hypothetical protein